MATRQAVKQFANVREIGVESHVFGSSSSSTTTITTSNQATIRYEALATQVAMGSKTPQEIPIVVAFNDQSNPTHKNATSINSSWASRLCYGQRCEAVCGSIVLFWASPLLPSSRLPLVSLAGTGSQIVHDLWSTGEWVHELRDRFAFGQ